MVVFDELRITEDGQYLIITAHLRKEIVEQDYANRINEIWVCDSSKYKEGIPSDLNPIGTKVYSWGSPVNERHKVDIKISASDPNYANLPTSFKGKMLFVYVNVLTVEEPVLSCGCASNPALGVALDMGPIYEQFIKYIDELRCRDKCSKSTPQGLTDFILRFNAMLLAIDSKHYKIGIEFFNKWFNGKSVPTTSSCGCHA